MRLAHPQTFGYNGISDREVWTDGKAFFRRKPQGHLFGRRKELQQEIDSIDNQISNMKKRISTIVREYKFNSMQAFYKELNAAKKENLDYQAVHAECEKTYGDKAVDPVSLRDRIKQMDRIVREREADRVHQAKQKDKGAR